MKRCSHAAHEGPNPLPVSEFYQRSDRPGALTSACKACSNRKKGTCSACGEPAHIRKNSRENPVCHKCRRTARGCDPDQPMYLIDPADRARIGQVSACEQCGGEFTIPAINAAQRFCSQACSQVARRDTAVWRTCGWCGKRYRRESRADDQDPGRRRGKGKTCSMECRALLQKERSDSWPRCKVYHVNCSECGVLFIGRRARAAACSDECRRERQIRITSANIMHRYRENPAFRDLLRSKGQNRRASLLGLDGITYPSQVIAYLMAHDEGICQLCRNPVTDEDGPWGPSMDHVIPLRRGGKHEIGNLQLAHYRCNLIKHARILVWLDRAGYDAWLARYGPARVTIGLASWDNAA